MMELLHRRQSIKGKLTLAYMGDKWQSYSVQDMIETEPLFANDMNDNLQCLWLSHGQAKDGLYAKSAEYFDQSLYFSPYLSIQKIWPAIDPLYSQSSLLQPVNGHLKT